MRISDWSSDVCSSDLNEELAIAAAAESQSEHPIAYGIVAEANTRNLAIPKAIDVRNITGEGIAAKVDAQDVRIVSPGHLARQGKPITHERLKQLEADGKTVVALVRDDEPRALFALADIVRPESKEASADLSRLGLTSVHVTVEAQSGDDA